MEAAHKEVEWFPEVMKNLISAGTPAVRAGINYFVHGVSPSMRTLERSIADIAPTDILFC